MLLNCHQILIHYWPSSSSSGLVPCRFLTMVSHLVLLLTVLLSRDDFVRACLPFDHDADDFARKDVELVSAQIGRQWF